MFEPEAFHRGLEKTFLMAFTIERIKSFLAKRRLPQFGQDANNDTYSVSLLLFQLCEHDKQFIFHLLFDPEAFHNGKLHRNYPQTKNPMKVGLDVYI